MTLKPRIEINLPFGIGKFTLENDQTQQKAAWDLYIELVTRITLQPLDPKSGLLREALDSIYKVFQLTRDVLHAAGPDVSGGEKSVGTIAMRVLNDPKDGIRQFTSYWHPRLQNYEKNRPPNVSAYEHEQNWSDNPAMRRDLEILQVNLEEYAKALAAIAGVQHIAVERPAKPRHN